MQRTRAPNCGFLIAFHVNPKRGLWRVRHRSSELLGSKTATMSFDPLSQVTNEPLSVSAQAFQQLVVFRASTKFTELPGVDTAVEQACLSQVFDELLDRLIVGVLANPNKLWVMSHFQTALEAVQMEDTEGREQFGVHLEQVMDILQIESSDGLLSFYL